MAEVDARMGPRRGLGDLPGEFEQAPRARRIVAGAIDVGLAAVPLLLFSGDLPPWLALFSGSWPLSKAMHLAPALYLLLRDSIDGRSIGKLMTGLQVIEVEQGRPANLVDSVVRNGWLSLATLPWIGPPIAVAWGSIAGTQIVLGAPRRFGEGFAATRVVRARSSEAGVRQDEDRRPDDE